MEAVKAQISQAETGEDLSRDITSLRRQLDSKNANVAKQRSDMEAIRRELADAESKSAELIRGAREAAEEVQRQAAKTKDELEKVHTS